jgi:hypothetical protein
MNLISAALVEETFDKGMKGAYASHTLSNPQVPWRFLGVVRQPVIKVVISSVWTALALFCLKLVQLIYEDDK